MPAANAPASMNAMPRSGTAAPRQCHHREGGDDADDGAEAGEPRRLRHHQADDRRRRGAERHADADFARALAEHVDEHAVEPRDAERQRDAAEDRADPGRRRSADTSASTSSRGAADIERQRVGMQRLQHRSEVLDAQIARAIAAAHEQHVRLASGPATLAGKYRCDGSRPSKTSPVITSPATPTMTTVVLSVDQPHGLADGIFAGPERTCARRADDRDGSRRRASSRLERAAAQDRDAQDRKVVRRHARLSRRDRRRRVVSLAASIGG